MLQDNLQGPLLMQEEQHSLHCSMQMPQLWLQQPSWLKDDSRWRWCMTVAEDEQGWHSQKIARTTGTDLTQ